jgi:hypothetical protein
MAAAGTLPRTSLTRALYAPVVLIAPAIAAYFFVDGWLGYLTNLRLPWSDARPPLYLSMVTLAGFIVPGALAWRRVIRRLPLIPETRLRRRPVVAALVALFCAFTLGMAILITLGIADALAKAADDIGGPLAFFCMIMALAAAIAMLVAEMALVDRYSSAESSGHFS